MIDRAYSFFDHSITSPDWRTGLESYAHRMLALLQRHRWLTELNHKRLPLAPHVLDAREAGLRTLIDTELPLHQIVEVLELVDNFIWGVATSTAREASEREATGQEYGDYWQRRSDFWETYFDVDRYPVMTKIYLAGAFDNGADVDRMLHHLLDSVEHLIDRAAESTEHRPGTPRS